MFKSNIICLISFLEHKLFLLKKHVEPILLINNYCSDSWGTVKGWKRNLLLKWAPADKAQKKS